MKYMLPDGSPATQAQWAEAFRNPSNYSMAHHNIAEFVIRTSWVGIAFDHEDEPLFYLSTVHRTVGSRDKLESLADYWTPTKAAAESKHAELVETFTDKTQPRRKRGRQ